MDAWSRAVVWKCGVSLLPRDPEHTERFGGREVAGKSSALGLHNLLRKCIPTGNILDECMKHWSASVSATRPKQIKDRDKIRAVIAAENGRPTTNDTRRSRVIRTGRGTRTPTGFRPADFESAASSIPPSRLCTPCYRAVRRNRVDGTPPLGSDDGVR